MDFMEVSREIVNAYYRRREGSEDYVVRIDFEPNPLNYDGVDEVSACVVRKVRTSSDFNAPKAETVVVRTQACDTIEEALTKLTNLVIPPSATHRPANRLPIWTEVNGCSHCEFCGMDMSMDPYCAHPNVTKKHPYGLNINKAVQEFCVDKDNNLTLWSQRKNTPSR